MKISCKNLKAFTLAEVAVVFFVIAIVVSATAKITASRMNYVKQFMYYSTFTNLRTGMGELIAEGCPNDTQPTVCPVNEIKTLPIKGNYSNGANLGFCQRLSNIMNTIGGVNCNQPAIASGTSDFSALTSNFVTTNGARYYNFGIDPVFGEAIAGPYNATPENDIYTVYVDIDGTRNKALLDDDVLEFKIIRTGMVLPAPASLGALSTNYLSASVKYKDASGNTVLLRSGVSFKEAECVAGVVTNINYPNYCDHSPTNYVADSNCTAVNNTCKVVINKPGF